MLSRFLTQSLRKSQAPLFRPFSEVLKSVPDHKAPLQEESFSGRYAGVLFTIASKNEILDQINEDMEYLNQLNTESESFRNFLINTSNTRALQQEVFGTINGQFHQITRQFLDVVIDNKRTTDLAKMAQTYIMYCKMLNKEESVRVVSAAELTEEQKVRLMDTLTATKTDTKFTMKYDVDANILGGLQIYMGNTFLDCSLLSRVNVVRGELSKMYT